MPWKPFKSTLSSPRLAEWTHTVHVLPSDGLGSRAACTRHLLCCKGYPVIHPPARVLGRVSSKWDMGKTQRPVLKRGVGGFLQNHAVRCLHPQQPRLSSCPTPTSSRPPSGSSTPWNSDMRLLVAFERQAKVTIWKHTCTTENINSYWVALREDLALGPPIVREFASPMWKENAEWVQEELGAARK